MIAVIGSGPAGISAAIYIKRANIPVMVFTNHKSSLLKATTIENYYGTGKISGETLYHKGIESAKALDINIIDEEVLNISVEDTFRIETSNNTYICDGIILATGVKQKKETISGASEFDGKGVSYCATCDGYFFKNKRIIVIGSGEYATHEYAYLENLTDSIIQISDANTIDKIMGDIAVEKILLKDGSEIEADGIFIANGYPDSIVLARKIGIIEQDGCILVDEAMQTNVPGLFACGDITKGKRQIAKAVYEGMVAAESAIAFLKK